MSAISDETKIAENFTVKDWKEKRIELFSDLENAVPSEEIWSSVFDIYKKRVESRFLNPLDYIINRGTDQGKKSNKNEMLLDRLDKNNIKNYRNNYHKALIGYIEDYRKRLLRQKELRVNFIRKMDKLAGIERMYYFAYGSNLKKERLQEKIEEKKKERNKPYLIAFHTYYKGFLKGYEFVFNKKSIDGTSKANIRKSGDKSKVWGVCFEMDNEAFELLKEFENGYETQEVQIRTDFYVIIAETFISNNVSDIPPDKNYIKKIIDGAKEMALPEEYISYIIEKSNCT